MIVRDDKLPRRLAVWAFVVLVAADLWSIERLYWHFSPPASVTFAPDSADRYLQQLREPGRVIAAPLGPETVARDPVFYDALMVQRVRQVMGYHGNQLRRYDELLGRDEGYRRATSPQIWRLLNTRFLLTNVGNVQAPGIQLVVGPVKDAAGATIYLYKLPGDNPAAWVTPVNVKAGDEQALATVTDQRFDPLVAAIYDTAAPVQGQQVQTLPNPLGIAATVTRYDPGDIVVHLERAAPAGASLVVSENYYPGWQATVDGKPAPIGRTDYTLIGVPLPTGASSVELTFHDAAYARGKIVTYVAALFALGWLLVCGVLLRRRHG
jgi:hypothetical protein